MAIGPNAPTSATRPIEVIWREVHERWGKQITSYGVSVCKYIKDTTTPSQHSWGNAWDIHGPIAVVDRIAAFLRSAAMRPYVAQVLWRGVPGHYPGHLHVTGRPMFVGVPPCMGGEGRPIREGPGITIQPIPKAGELVASETWAPAARVAARELERMARRIVHVPAALQRMMPQR